MLLVLSSDSSSSTIASICNERASTMPSAAKSCFTSSSSASSFTSSMVVTIEKDLLSLLKESSCWLYWLYFFTYDGLTRKDGLDFAVRGDENLLRSIEVKVGRCLPIFLVLSGVDETLTERPFYCMQFTASSPFDNVSTGKGLVLSKL